MNWQTVITGLAAVVTGLGGSILLVMELRRRDRTALKLEVDELSKDVSFLRMDLISCRRYAFGLAERLALLGLEVDDPPDLHPGIRE